ncbi:MAG TPA: PAS domain-containing protein [Vicinamibacterales bacterium]|nr:PAS domain-containing protein [Vicinamibacterales bacterium]
MTAPTTPATFQIDCDGRIASWPDAARDLFDRTSGAALGLPLAAFIESRQRDACENVVHHLCHDPRAGAVHTMELLAERANGSTFHVECSLWRCPNDPTRFDVLARDITDRVRIEQDLRQQLRELRQFSASQIQEIKRSQARFIDIAETIDEVFWMADPAVTRMIYISPGYERIWGRSCASLYEDPRSFIEAIHPDDRERVLDDLRCQREGLPFDHEYRIVRPDGTVLWIWDRGFPVRNPDGAVDRYIGVAQDISVRKASEAAVRRQEMLDAIGHMTGGLAHDFNNVLGVVVGHLDLISLAIADNPTARESVDRALDAALRGSRLARRLLALARREPLERRVLRLADAVNGLVPLLEHAAGPETVLVVRAEDNLLVNLDPGELDAALINLAINARAAMPRGGRLTLELSSLELSSHPNAYALPAGRYASIVVDDTGVGMTDDVLRRIGEPFFTTKPDREGTGLGISMIYAFVRRSGGVLRVESTPGQGSRFRLVLPVASGSAVDDGWTAPRPALDGSAAS